MTMADKIVVLRGGRIEQVGSPLALYNRPANRFVAGFIGSPQMNFIACTAAAPGRLDAPFGGSLALPRLAVPAGRPLVLGVRPEHLHLQAMPDALALPLQVVQVEQLGGLSLIYGELPAGAGRVTVQVAGQVGVRVGEALVAHAPAAACHLFEADEAGLAVGP
jgi:ABC-type sugar transport system ATPase subunit